jgi:hypothetical protein
MIYKISPNPSLPAHGRKKTPKRGISLPLVKGGEEGFYEIMSFLL